MPTRAAALAVLILAAMVLGFAPILVRLADAGPAAAGFWRFAFALPWLLVMTARPGGEGVGRPSNWMVLAGVMLVLDLGFWHYSIALTSVANATTLTNLTPVVVTLVGWFVFRDRPKALFLVALAAAIAGAVTMSLGADGGQGSNPPLGDVFAAVTALWYAGYFIAVKGARDRHSAGRVMLCLLDEGAPPQPALDAPAATLDLQRTTFLGTVHGLTLSASDCIFDAPAQVQTQLLQFAVEMRSLQTCAIRYACHVATLTLQMMLKIESFEFFARLTQGLIEQGQRRSRFGCITGIAEQNALHILRRNIVFQRR